MELSSWKNLRLELAVSKILSMHIRMDVKDCCVRDRESCIDKSNPTFARSAYTWRGSPLKRGILVTYPHDAPWTRWTADFSEKSPINADVRGRRES